MKPRYTQLLNGLLAELRRQNASTRLSTYLEIGSGYGGNFEAIESFSKVGVDPFFPCSAQMPSNQFFENQEPRQMYDLIYIDGDDSPEQIQRDVLNALKFLQPKGLVVVRDIHQTPEKTAAWANVRKNCPYRTFYEDIEYGAGIIDTAFLRGDTYDVSVQHNFVPVNANFGHFLSEVMPMVHHFCETHYLLGEPQMVQFYCDNFFELLRAYSTNTIRPFKSDNAILLREAPREMRRGLNLLAKVRDKVMNVYLDSDLHIRPNTVTILHRATTRTLAREEGLREAIERRFNLFAKIVDPAKLSLSGQMLLAANTRVLIGVHGAGMALSVFMPRGMAVIEITPPTYPTWWYKQFADKFELSYHSVDGPALLNGDQMPTRELVEVTPIEVHFPTIFALIERELFPERYPV